MKIKMTKIQKLWIESSILTFIAAAGLAVDWQNLDAQNIDKALLIAVAGTALRAGLKAVWVMILIPLFKKWSK